MTHRLIGPAITDVAGEPAGQVQVERLIARYHWTASYCEGRVVLEVACGTGQGLGLLRDRAKNVYACDLSADNLSHARSNYARGVGLFQANAQVLPVASESVEVVILLETLYFLPSAALFLAEARRVLRPGGHLLVSSINKDCPDFNPKHPLYFAHYGAPELSSLIESHNFVSECFGIVPMDQPSIRSQAFKPLKRFAVRLNLIPESMQARRFLKRIVFGRLNPMPHDISSLAGPSTPPRRIPTDRADTVHQVVLCAGRRL